MARERPLSADRWKGAESSAGDVGSAADRDRSALRTDVAVLFAAIFLQRFSLPYSGGKLLQLDLVAIGGILLYQFVRGKLLIQYDRLLWYLPLFLVTTSSLLLNPKSSTTAYVLFLAFYAMYTLTEPTSSEQYKKTLQSFQLLVLILSCLGVAQFIAQFFMDVHRIVNFYGIFPDYLLAAASDTSGTAANHLIRSNGIFLVEPSSLSQITALGILFEILEFRRTRYLIAIVLGFLVAYSGTGSLALLLFLPLVALRDKAALPVLLVVIFALGFFATGIIDSSAFTSRANEFVTPGTSGYARFVSPFILAAKEFDTVSLRELLVGSGPGTVTSFSSTWVNIWYTGGFAATWIKYLYEYGIIGSLIFCFFLMSCFSKSRCPGVVIAAIIFSWVFLQGSTTIAIALCTLNRAQLRSGRVNETHEYRSSVGTAAKTV